MLVAVANQMVALASDALHQAIGDNDIEIDHGPGAWDGEYIEDLLTTLPAVRVALMSAVVANETSLSLRPSEWAIYVAVGWGQCRTPTEIQLGADGTHTILDALLYGMHNSQLRADNGVLIGHCKMQTLSNLWQGGFRRLRIAVFQMTAVVDMPIELERPDGTLREFLRTGVEWDIDGGGEPDMTDTINMREAT